MVMTIARRDKQKMLWVGLLFLLITAGSADPSNSTPNEPDVKPSFNAPVNQGSEAGEDVDGYRKAKWGMTKEEVKKILISEKITIAKETVGQIDVSSDILGPGTKIEYKFSPISNKLSKVEVTYYDLTAVFRPYTPEESKKLLRPDDTIIILSKKYGAPAKSKHQKGEFTEIEELFVWWEKPSGKLSFSLLAKSGFVLEIISYESTKFSKSWTKKWRY